MFNKNNFVNMLTAVNFGSELFYSNIWILSTLVVQDKIFLTFIRSLFMHTRSRQESQMDVVVEVVYIVNYTS